MAVLVGDHTQYSASQIGAGTVIYWEYIATATGILTGLEVYSAVSGNVKFAIYSDNGSDQPVTLLASGTKACTLNQWNQLTGLSVPVTNGTKYWIVYITDTLGVTVRNSTGSQKRYYKTGLTYSTFSYPATWDGPTSYTYDATYTTSFDGVGTVEVDVTVNAPTATVSSTAPAPTVHTSAVSSPPVATVTSLALAPSVSVGINATVNAPAGIVTSQAYAPTVTAARNVTSSPPAATVTSQAYIVVAGPMTGVVVSPPAAIVSSQAYTVSTTVPFHIIWEASYEIDIPQVNRAFIVGEDLAGSLVTGNAILQAEVDLVGERLEVQHTPAAITAAVAADVAVAVLGKNRLDGQKGKILIPPHCCLELWDVLNVVDAGADQSGNYRVSGYSLEYDVQAGQYQQQLDLSAI
jgi:hypothetical protein